MQKGWVVDIVRHLPQGAVSRAWGWLARRERPRLAVAVLKRIFVRAVGVDMSESRQPIYSFTSLESLFVRQLRVGLRRVDPDAATLVSPVDGTVGQNGIVQDGTLLQIKGRHYNLADLLGNTQDAVRYEGGSYITLYLAPRDYHRIHAPLSGQVSEAVIIPGGLLPVFPEALKRVDGLFARNERIITYLDTPHAGRLAIVKVGATLVGRITLAYDPNLWSNQRRQRQRRVHYNPPRLLQKGAEVGAFELGSTVILLCEPGRFQADLGPVGSPVRLGSSLGKILSARGQAKQAGARPRRKVSNGTPMGRKAPGRAPSE